MSTASSAPDVPPEREPDLVDKFGQKMMVNDINIHYVRVGKGSQPLLLMPGGTGEQFNCDLLIAFRRPTAKSTIKLNLVRRKRANGHDAASRGAVQNKVHFDW